MTKSGSPLLRDRNAVRVYIVLLACSSAWCAGFLLAPLLGPQDGVLHGLSGFFYDMFNRVCHQREDHSFHLMGEKFGVCIRCSSIYFSFFLTLLAFPILHHVPRVFALPRGWLIASVFPMVIDVTLSILGIHTSSTATRIVTGMIFGCVAVLFLVPPALEAGGDLFFRHKTSTTINSTE